MKKLFIDGFATAKLAVQLTLSFIINVYLEYLQLEVICLV